MKYSFQYIKPGSEVIAPPCDYDQEKEPTEATVTDEAFASVVIQTEPTLRVDMTLWHDEEAIVEFTIADGAAWTLGDALRCVLTVFDRALECRERGYSGTGLVSDPIVVGGRTISVSGDALEPTSGEELWLWEDPMTVLHAISRRADGVWALHFDT